MTSLPHRQMDSFPIGTPIIRLEVCIPSPKNSETFPKVFSHPLAYSYVLQATNPFVTIFHSSSGIILLYLASFFSVSFIAVFFEGSCSTPPLGLRRLFPLLFMTPSFSFFLRSSSSVGSSPGALDRVCC